MTKVTRWPWILPLALAAILAGGGAAVDARVREAQVPAGSGDIHSRDRVPAIVAKYGLASLEGPAITAAGLKVLEEALGCFRRSDLRGLAIRFERPSPDPEDQAVWIPFAGEPPEGPARVPGPGPDPSPCEATGGEIRIFQETPQLHVLVHELVHHVTLFTDRTLLVELAGTLGYGVRGIDAGELCERLESERPFSPWRVAPSSFPNDYARLDVYEHVAEVVSWRLATRSFEDRGWPMEPGFTVPRATIAAIDGRFYRRVWTGGPTLAPTP